MFASLPGCSSQVSQTNNITLPTTLTRLSCISPLHLWTLSLHTQGKKKIISHLNYSNAPHTTHVQVGSWSHYYIQKLYTCYYRGTKFTYLSSNTTFQNNLTTDSINYFNLWSWTRNLHFLPALYTRLSITHNGCGEKRTGWMRQVTA